MTDNKKSTGSPDNKRIDINDRNEIRNWCKALGVTESVLIAAVKAVGTSGAAVRKHLGK